MKNQLIIVLASALAFPACNIQKFALRSIDGMFDNTMIALEGEEDLQIAEPAIASNLKLLDGLVRTDPENEKLLLMACQGYTSYALAFAEDSVDRARLFYTRAQQYGMRLLVLRGIADSVFASDPATMRLALRRLDRDDVPAVFWTVNAWGSAVNLRREDPSAIASLPTINAMMEWVMSQDSAYYYGGPMLYFGVYYGSLPSILGGKPDLAKSFFDRAVAASGGKFLMTYVFYAKTYAIQTQNEDLFVDLLTRVVQAPADILPEQNLANAVARARARSLLGHKADFF